MVDHRSIRSLHPFAHVRQGVSSISWPFFWLPGTQAPADEALQGHQWRRMPASREKPEPSPRAQNREPFPAIVNPLYNCRRPDMFCEKEAGPVI